MSGTDSRLVVEAKDTGSDALEHLVGVGSPEIGAADAALKKSVAREQSFDCSRVFRFVEPQTNTPWAMARSVNDRKLEVTYRKIFAVLKVMINREWFIVMNSEELSLFFEG